MKFTCTDNNNCQFEQQAQYNPNGIDRVVIKTLILF